MDGIIDLLDIAAKEYPIKALAPEMGKGESTLRNELTQQPGYKLGIMDAVLIMKKTSNLRALDRIEGMFNRTAFVIPHPEYNNTIPIMNLVANLSEDFSDTIGAMAAALRDSVITKQEAKQCIKENKELIKACIELQAYLQKIIQIQEL